MWADKYKPKSIVEWIGDRQKIDIVIDFIESWVRQNPYLNSLILSGEAGCGKTSIVYAISKDLGLDVYEVNASDLRSKAMLKKIRQLSVLKSFGERSTKIILLDEADNIHRSGWKELEMMIKNAGNPIVITANFLDKIPWKIRQMCGHVELSKPDVPRLVRKLKRIIDSENLSIPEKKLKKIATICPSVRSAITTLEMCVLSNNFKHIQIRDVDLSPIEQVRKLFAGESVSLNMSAKEVLRWALVNGIPYKQLRDCEVMLTNSRQAEGLTAVVNRFVLTFRGKGKLIIPKRRPKKKSHIPVKRKPKQRYKDAVPNRKKADLEPRTEAPDYEPFDDIF